MAGFYPDVPDYRIPYDTDGAAMFYWSSTIPSIVLLSETQKRGCNSENPDVAYSNDHSSGQSIVGFVFPELRRVSGYFLNISYIPTQIQYSVDTTTGLNGTWADIDQTTFFISESTLSLYRTNINNITMNSGNPIKGIRFTGTSNNPLIKAVHLYGKRVAAADKIVFWHPTLNQEVSPSYFDFGDINRITQYEKQFRLKNVSTTKAANNISVTLDATTETDPNVLNQFLLSDDGITYSSSLNVDFIAKEGVSNILYLKKDFIENSIFGPASFRIKTNPQIWVGV